MKWLLFFSVLVVLITVSIIVYFESGPPAPITSLKIPEVSKIQPQNTHLFAKVNVRSQGIKTFSCSNATVTVWRGRMRVNLTADLHYEKPKRFRMKVDSAFGEELDLGSNDQVFWFWSKRLKPEGLYYATHEDFHKTRLKTPFNPVWMMRSLGLDDVNLNAKYVDLGEKYVLIEKTQNSVGEAITKFTYIRKATMQVYGFIVADVNGALITSAEITEFQNDLPKKILYVWFEEDTSMLLEMEDAKTNQILTAASWEMPNKQPQMDMGLD